MYFQGELKLGAPYSSGPFGGDAQLAAAIVSGDIGCLIFFVDPLSTQPHTADVDSLIRLARVHEILLGILTLSTVYVMWKQIYIDVFSCCTATNSMTAYSIIEALRVGLRDYEELPAPMKVGDETMSAAVPAYKKRKSVDKAAKGAM